MTNPFKRAPSLSDPARNIVPVTPDDNTDLADIAVALYVETGGTLAIHTLGGALRTIKVADFSILPVGVRRVLAAGTTATGIHAMTVME
ncbi:MAG: hypothetical protein K0B00_09065 [Rhodobacteraceae bacterium]|nr:hypothetical protein [Paracoccaceae bacterium]